MHNNSSIAVVDWEVGLRLRQTPLTNVRLNKRQFYFNGGRVASGSNLVSVDVVALSHQFANAMAVVKLATIYKLRWDKKNLVRCNWFNYRYSALAAGAAHANSNHRQHLRPHGTPGNHAYQSTLRIRADGTECAGGKYLNTAALATQNVTRWLQPYRRCDLRARAASPLSGTATGTYTAGAHSVVISAGMTSTVTGTVTNADLRPELRSTLPPYQRVNHRRITTPISALSEIRWH